MFSGSPLDKIKQIINEEYFKIRESALDDLYDAINNLLVYTKYSISSKYKLKFYIQRFVEALSKIKHEKFSATKLDSIINSLEDNFDKDYLTELGVITLLKKMKKNSNSEDIINDYIVLVKDTINDFIKNHEKYRIDNDKQLSEEKYLLQIELLKLQEWIIKNDKRVLIIFEGRDGSGKGRNIKKIAEFLNPKHYRIEGFSIPTEEEKKDWYKRYEKLIPEKGEMVFFDRSWYNRGIIEPAMGYCTKAEHEEFMDSVINFEKKLVDKDVDLIKIWLNVNKLNQIMRFELRRIDPLKYWKFSENDDKILEKWDELTPYINRVLTETNHEHGKWKIIDANDKQKSFNDTVKAILNEFDYEHKNNNMFNQNQPIIFLDLHGVLITNIQLDKNGDKICDKGWDADAIANLNHLTDATKANLVLISSCKNHYTMTELKEMFDKAGITGNLIDKTININKNLRSKQIDTWFELNGKPKKWIVLDDKKYGDYKEYLNHVIDTNYKVGFTHENLKVAINKLK